MDSKKSIMKPSKKRSGIFRSGCQKRDRNRKLSEKMRRSIWTILHILMGDENRVFWSIRMGLRDLLECLPENLENMNGDIAVVCCMILESTVSGSREDFKKEMFRWTIRRPEHNFVRRKEDTTRF